MELGGESQTKPERFAELRRLGGEIRESKVASIDKIK